MTSNNLLRAKDALKGNTIALCKGEDVLTSDKRGIAPMLGFISENRDLSGYAVADAVVGKAAALLFVYAGIAEVYARVISEAALKVLTANDVPVEYSEKVAYIINRRGDDICPMEKTVLQTDDSVEALTLLRRKVAELSKIQ